MARTTVKSVDHIRFIGFLKVCRGLATFSFFPILAPNTGAVGSPYLDGASAIVELTHIRRMQARPISQRITGKRPHMFVKIRQVWEPSPSPSRSSCTSPRNTRGVRNERQGFYSWHISGVQRMPNGNTMVISASRSYLRDHPDQDGRLEYGSVMHEERRGLGFRESLLHAQGK